MPAIVAASAALAVPAGAQFFNDRSVFGQRAQPQLVQLREFFPFSFWGERSSPSPYGQPQRPPVDSSKAPAPHKVETPPSSAVLVIGDSLADWLGYGLEEAFADAPEFGIVRKIRANSGLVHYETRSEQPEWSQAIKDVLATEKPNAIVIMLGVNDRQALRERTPPRTGPQHNGEQQTPQASAAGHDEKPAAQSSSESAQESSATEAESQHRGQGASYEFRTDKWAELYSKRIDDMIAALKSKGVPVLWVGLPAIHGTRSTSDVSYLDELYRARAEKAGIIYVDIWDGFVDEGGRYTAQGPDFEGQIRRLRSSDGVHFTKAGAVKLAHYVEHELRRAMSSHVVPVALPGAEQSPAKAGALGARPAAGPVVPLGAIGSGEGSDLLGAGGRSAPSTTDPIVTRVLSRGDAISAPAGRADDFSWPRADISTSGSAEVEPPPVAAPPPAPPKGSTGKTEAKKPTNDAKGRVAPDAAATRPRRSQTDLDGTPPRPPLPVGPAAANSR